MRRASVHFDKSSTVETWGGQATARFSADNSLQICGRDWGGQTIHESENAGKGTDGKFGPNLFDDQIIEIDFDNSLIVVHPWLPTIDPEYQMQDLIIDEHENMFVNGTVNIGDSEIGNHFMIHSGFEGTLLLDEDFVTNNGSINALKIVSESKLSDSYGNVIKTKKAILPAFKIGNVILHDVPVAFFDGAIGQQRTSVLGGDILKRINMLIDRGNRTIYLKPNTLTADDFLYGD